MKKMIYIALATLISLLFSACTNSKPVVKSPSFIEGEKDGCTTASGSYTKNGEAFNNDQDYADGWFYGRKKCNPVQARINK